MNKLYYAPISTFCVNSSAKKLLLCYIDPPFYAKDVVSAEMNDEAKYKAVTEPLKQTI